METSVLIQIPYELESAYSPLEERTDIDYAVMSVDNFNVGEFLIGLYITISSDSVAAGVMSAIIWDTVKTIARDVLDKLIRPSGTISQKQITSEQETCIRISLCIQENSKNEYRMVAEYTVNRNLDDDNTNRMSENMMNQLKEMARAQYEKNK